MSESKRRARDLRRHSTQPEQMLWYRLRSRRLMGLKFRRQVCIGRFIVDFCCPEKTLVIEVDGESHVGRGRADAARDAELRSRGYTVLRVTNDEVLHELDVVCQAIADACCDPPSP